MNSKNYYSRPMQLLDLTKINLRPIDKLDLIDYDLKDLALQYLQYPSWSLCFGEQVIASYGVIISEGTATLWAITGIECEECFVRLSRILKTTIYFAESVANCHRVQALVHIKNKRSYNWLKRIGKLRTEGLLRKCGENKQDRYILARVSNFC